MCENYTYGGAKATRGACCVGLLTVTRSGSVITQHAPRTTTLTALPRVQLPRDHDPLDLARPLVDLGDLRLAEEALDRVLLHVAVAAEDLHRLVGDVHRRLAREQLAH